MNYVCFKDRNPYFSVIFTHILQITIFHMLNLCGQLSCTTYHSPMMNIGAWWKRQPDVDSVDRRSLTFSTGRRQPDWAFLLVDVNQTELFYWLTSWSTVDAVDARWCCWRRRLPILLTFSSRPIYRQEDFRQGFFIIRL